MIKQRVFDRQFKIEAVRLAYLGEITVFQIVQALKISVPTLYRWIDEWERNKENAFPWQGFPVTNPQFEIRKLQKKVA